MAIPPRADAAAPRNVPWVSLALVAANGLAFVFTLFQGAEAGEFLDRFGLVPRELFGGSGGGPGAWLSPLSAMFLHGGWLHLAGNLFYLWIFGPRLEHRLGARTYLGFYLACGLVAAAIHVASDPSGFVPTVGASGAVAGLLGAYAADGPRRRFRLFWPRIRVPALVLLGLWVAGQLISGLTSVGSGAVAVASWAHWGGFLAGFAGIRWLGSRGLATSDAGR